MSSSQHRPGMFPVAHLIARKVARAGENPYSDDRDRYLLLDDGEVIEFGRPLRNHPMFGVCSRAKIEKLAGDFATFNRQDPHTDWRFWTLCRPTQKSRIDDLESDYRELNQQLNRVFTDIRKRFGFEFVLCGVHVRFDFESGLFDLHVHVICRTPPDALEEVKRRLLTEFSRADLPDDRLRSPAAAARYVAKAYNAREVVRWPEEALLAAFRLGGLRLHYTRTAGSFATWRAAQKAPADPHHLALVRARRKNRAETRYRGRGWEYQDRLLVTRDWNFAGAVVRGSLYQRARRRAAETASAPSSKYPSATCLTTQATPVAPAPAATQSGVTTVSSAVQRATRWAQRAYFALKTACTKAVRTIYRVFHLRE